MKNPKSIFKIAAGLSFCAIIAAIAVLLYIDFFTVKNKTVIPLTSSQDIAVKGDLYSGGSDYAVIIATDKTSEHNRIKSLIRFFYDSDATVLAYSYEGAGDDDILTQNAINEVKSRTGLPGDKIILLGYGVGGSKILDYVTAGGHGQMGVILLAPYGESSHIEVGSVASPILVLGTTSDDISTPEMVTNFYNNLSGDDIKATGFAFKSSRSNVSLKIISGVYNAYNAYSRQVLTDISSWLGDNLGISGVVNLTAPTLRIYSWIIAIAALAAFLICIYNVLIRSIFHTSYSLVSGREVFPAVFFILKISLWIAVIPISLAAIFFVWLTPAKAQIIPVSFAVFICVNAVSVFVAYKYVKLPFIDKINRFITPAIVPKRLVQSLAVILFTGALAAVLSYTGLFGLEFSILQIALFVVMSVLSCVGFYYVFFENLLLDEMKAHYLTKGIFQGVSYIPLAVFAVISIPLANFTALLTSLVYLLVLYICILICRIVGHLTANPFITAVSSGILFAGFLSFVII